METKTRRKWLKRMARTMELEPDASVTGRRQSRGENRDTSGCPCQKLSLPVQQAVLRAVMHDTNPLRNWKLTQKNRGTSPRY